MPFHFLTLYIHEETTLVNVHVRKMKRNQNLLSPSLRKNDILKAYLACRGSLFLGTFCHFSLHSWRVVLSSLCTLRLKELKFPEHRTTAYWSRNANLISKHVNLHLFQLSHLPWDICKLTFLEISVEDIHRRIMGAKDLMYETTFWDF